MSFPVVFLCVGMLCLCKIVVALSAPLQWVSIVVTQCLLQDSQIALWNTDVDAFYVIRLKGLKMSVWTSYWREKLPEMAPVLDLCKQGAGDEDVCLVLEGQHRCAL